MNDAYDIADVVAAECKVTRARMRARALTRAYDAALAPIGLKSTEYAVLVAVGRLRAARLHEIAEALSMDLSTLSRSIAKLSEKGLVTVTAHGHRTRSAALAPAGHDVLRAGYPLWMRAQANAG